MKRGYFQSSSVLCVLSLLVLLSLTLFVVGCPPPNPPSTHRQPTANFTMNHNSGQAPLIVQFEDASSPGSAPIVSWSWNFGDPTSGDYNTSSFQNPSHVFNAPGTYTVRLTVNNAYGSSSTTRTVTVSAGSQTVVIDPKVRVVDDIPTLSLQQINGNDFTFLYTGNGAPPVQPGDILVGTQGEGFLRQVASVKSLETKSDGSKSAVIATEFCSLAEAVREGSLHLDDIQFTAADFEKAGIRLAKSGEGFVTLNGFTLSDSFTATLDGDVSFNPSIDFDIDISGGFFSAPSLDYLKMTAGGTLGLDFDVTLENSTGLSYTFEKSVFPALPPTHTVVAMIGPVPVVLVTQLDIKAGIALNAQGGFSLQTGFDSSTNITVGAEYDGDWKNLSSIDVDANGHTPIWTIELESGIQIFLKPEVHSRLYGVTGPCVAAIPYLGFTYAPVPTPATATLKAGIDALLEFDVINLEIIKVDFSLGYHLPIEGPSYILWQWVDDGSGGGGGGSGGGGGGGSGGGGGGGSGGGGGEPQPQSIVAWGLNSPSYGECNVPEPNTGFIAVAAGENHSLGLKSDGTVVAWGGNTYGQCTVPSPNANFIAIAAGHSFSLGLKSDHSIVAWGRNDYSQCDVPSPNANFIAIAAGENFALGLKADGSIVAWGENDHHQCDVPTPNSGFSKIAAGSDHALALKQDGTILAWGWNTYGQCNVPSPNNGFVEIGAGNYSSMGIKTDGSIVAWGLNTYGQCTVPTPNSGFTKVDGGTSHSLALKSDGSVVAWGSTDYGVSDEPSPNTGFIAIAAGGWHNLAIRQ